MPRYPGFVGPSATAQSKIAAYDQLVNWYVEKTDSGSGASPYALYPAPGFASYCTLPTTPVRPAFYTLNGATFAVGGDSLYQLPFVSGGSPTLRASGLHNPDDSLVTIAGNGDGGFQLMITSGSRLYCFDLRTNVLTEIPDIVASVVVFVNGTFVALDPNSSSIYISAVEDGTSWDLLDVSQRSDVPDKWIALTISNKRLWLMGLQTSSIYYNSEDPEFPFVPDPSVFIPAGIRAPASLCNVAGAPMWLGASEDGGDVVYRAQGYSPVPVSTFAVSAAIASYAIVTDARAICYTQRGHTFYVLTFPSADKTWVFDATMGMWHERGQHNGLDFGAWPVFGHTYMNGLHLVGDTTSGVIYRMDPDIATDANGQGMVRRRRAPHVLDTDGMKLLVYDRLHVHLETGLGLATGQGEDPQLMLRWSNDGGQTWGNVHTVSAGLMGDYTAQAIWRWMGSARDRVFELTVSDPIPWRIIDAFLDVRVGRS